MPTTTTRTKSENLGIIAANLARAEQLVRDAEGDALHYGIGKLNALEEVYVAILTGDPFPSYELMAALRDDLRRCTADEITGAAERFIAGNLAQRLTGAVRRAQVRTA